jgi:hypothetical protein
MALLITIASTAESFRFDPINEQRSNPAVATENPVEQGADITDHVQVKPLRYSADIKLIDSPGALATETDIGNPLLDTGGRNPLLRGAEAAFAKQFFRTCQGLDDGIPKLLTLRTRFGVFTSMILLDWPQTGTNTNTLPTTLTFQQIRLANSGRVQIPRRVAGLGAGGKKTDDAGQQAPKVDDSILYDALTATAGGVRDLFTTLAGG